MALNKFEKHIKKQLQQREIAPSANAWERISEDLENNGKSEKKTYFWYGIAASFIGILLVSVVYYNLDNSEDIPNVQIVDNPKETNPIKNDEAIDASQESEDLDERVAVDALTKVGTKEEVVLDPLKVDRKNVEVVAVTSLEKKDSRERKIELPTESMYKVEEILNAKILEVVDQVHSLESENIDLTDAEVDSLLWKARKEMMVNKVILNDDKVDPMALLTDVEDQLDRSFRDKLFDRLKTGFIKVRAAVADSDN